MFSLVHQTGHPSRSSWRPSNATPSWRQPRRPSKPPRKRSKTPRRSGEKLVTGRFRATVTQSDDNDEEKKHVGSKNHHYRHCNDNMILRTTTITTPVIPYRISSTCAVQELIAKREARQRPLAATVCIFPEAPRMETTETLDLHRRRP